MAKTPDLVANEQSSAAWGNQIRDRTVQVFDDVAQRDTQWPALSAPVGATCRTISDGKWWANIFGAWTDVILFGPEGPPGQATIIVGEFGVSKTPADLPIDGVIPADWDAPGSPAGEHTMDIGHSLYYRPADEADPANGHLFQYVGPMMDPTGWLDIGLVRGPEGPEGPIGPLGPPGPGGTIVGSFGFVRTPSELPPDGNIPADWDQAGDLAHQMLVGESLIYSPGTPTLPSAGHLFSFVSTNSVPEGWVDAGMMRGPVGPDGPTGPPGVDGVPGPPGPPLPIGGLTGYPLVKLTDADGDVSWAEVTLVTTHGIETRGTNMAVVWPEGGRIYERSGGASIVLRKGTANRHPAVQNNDGSAETQIITADGVALMTGVLKWPTTVGDKLVLYNAAAGSRFGLGIESGTLSLFVEQAASKIGFKVGGTERAFIDQNGLGPRTSPNVSWQNGFTGSAQFRVNPAMVTLALWNFTNGVELFSFNPIKMFDYPAGVPAPWMNCSGAVMPVWMGSTYGYLPLRVDCRTDGVFMYAADYFQPGDLWECACTVTWAR